MNIFELQAEFLKAGDIEHPAEYNEEYEEWTAEEPYKIDNNINDLKEMCDLIYVCAQYLNMAVGPEAATKLFLAVHGNNMGKCIDGKLVKRADGKILKPEGFDKESWRPVFKSILEQ
jgi:predicted HAD superfamily Cof-like phosphohydrolase